MVPHPHRLIIHVLLVVPTLSNNVDAECKLPATCSSMLLQKNRHQDKVQGAATDDEAELASINTRNVSLTYTPQATGSDASFLIHATFGPTRASLSALAQMTKETYISEQMKIPYESHREYYRKRINTRYVHDIIHESAGFTSRDPCAEGSRWNRLVFTQADVGKNISVDNMGIYINKVFRSNLPSELPYPSPYEGKLCQVIDAVGEIGMVVFDDSGKKCNPKNKKNQVLLPNAEIYLSDESIAIETHATFHPLGFGLAILLTERLDPCVFEDDSYIKVDGKIYLHEPRLVAQKNDFFAPNPAICVPKTFQNKHTCSVNPKDSAADCLFTCGSPGEVANDPSLGYQLPLCINTLGVANEDYDNKYANSGNWIGRGKSTVWTMKAIYGEDQIRQRTAWALSQILVVSQANNFMKYANELWLNYYDIFVRHAFGNFRDVLKEVTYSPVMGEFLSYNGNAAFDKKGHYPDENFAREVMQLFTIGTKVLNPDGTPKLNEEGEPVQTYDNDDIMDMARVFTGLNWQYDRTNYEVNKRNKYRSQMNEIDPMLMEHESHDRYPKSTFNGKYLGDHYPLCSDHPIGSFLSAGAKYEFVGYTSEAPEDAFVPDSASALLAALCGSSTGVDCHHRAEVVLEETLSCVGAECDLRTVEVVRIGNGFYEFIPPTCVHLFFFNGRIVKWGSRFALQEQCANPDMPIAGTQCCGGCSDVPSPWLNKKRFTCKSTKNSAIKHVKKGCTSGAFEKDRSCQSTCVDRGMGYDRVLDFFGNCAAGQYREERVCAKFHHNMHYRDSIASCRGGHQDLCPHEIDTEKTTCGHDSQWLWTDKRCSVDVHVYDDGKISGHTKEGTHNKFRAKWIGTAAPEGSYPAVVENRVVISDIESLVSKEEMLTNLYIGAHAPTGACSLCEGDVKIYPSKDADDPNDSVLDMGTVFEIDGKFYKNQESVVNVGGYSFRNPPVFMPSGDFQLEGNAATRAATADIEAALDALMQHPNLPIFVCARLIQRFVTSNPPAQYLEAVAEAFKTGYYAGTPYLMQYGDLGATVAAILLYPEEHDMGPELNQGALREPLIMIVHFLRSMGYREGNSDEPDVIVLEDLLHRIGQFPYHSPTVFNFYDPDFAPPELEMQVALLQDAQALRPESQPEHMTAPEYQIMTAPYFVGFLNGLHTLAQFGVQNGCGGRDNKGFGQFASATLTAEDCPQGRFTVQASDSKEASVEELNLLLVGGRLQESTRNLMLEQYDQYSEQEGFTVLQETVLLTPEFHTMGPMPKTGVERPVGLEPEFGPKTSYKALIVIFLQGGLDSFNMVVPYSNDCALRDQYLEVREEMALPTADLLKISVEGQFDAEGQACKNFGMHKNLPYLHSLYENGQLSFVTNIGALVEPLTKNEFFDKTKRACMGMFSHKHQQKAAQTLKCQNLYEVYGTGGRLAEMLHKQAEKGMRTTTFSLAGDKYWAKSSMKKPDILDGKYGNVRLARYSGMLDVIDNFTHSTYRNSFMEIYTQGFVDSIARSENLGKYLDQVTLSSSYVFADTFFERDLYQVARVIATREVRDAERDCIFLMFGGWDTHKEELSELNFKFEELNTGLQGFVAEMEAQGVWDSIVITSDSDFGRTLTSNGDGTDHGWAQQQFILGGKVKGGQLLNDYPTAYTEGSNMDAGRGRLIPKYPRESLMVPVAEWMGLQESNKGIVFPNFENFNSSHIIPYDKLFVAS